MKDITLSGRSRQLGAAGEPISWRVSITEWLARDCRYYRRITMQRLGQILDLTQDEVGGGCHGVTGSGCTRLFESLGFAVRWRAIGRSIAVQPGNRQVMVLQLSLTQHAGTLTRQIAVFHW